jgi:dTDP-4-amino-4,6-dideoxygalactose transaminase
MPRPSIRPVSRRVIQLHTRDLVRLARAAASGELGSGAATTRFERAFADWVGHGRQAVAAGSGRLGLELVLRAWDLPAGSEVVLPAYEDLSVPRTIQKLGLVPVCADIDERTGNVSAETVAAVLGPQTRAVVVAHLFGQPAPMAPLQQLCSDRGLRLIEDCCHALGTTENGQHVGTFGDAAFFSFHATKPFMTLGGCMVLCRDEALAGSVRTALAALPPPPASQLRSSLQSAAAMRLATHPLLYGATLWPALQLGQRIGRSPGELYSSTVRTSVRLANTSVQYTDMQAVLGLNHLDGYRDSLARRRAHAATLELALRDHAELPLRRPGHCDYFFVLYTDHAAELRARLFARGLDTGHDLMRDCAAETGQDCPVVRRVRGRSVQIPCYEELSDRQIHRIAALVRRKLEDLGG